MSFTSKARAHCTSRAKPVMSIAFDWTVPERVMSASPVPAHVQMLSLMNCMVYLLRMDGIETSSPVVMITTRRVETGTVEPMGMYLSAAPPKMLISSSKTARMLGGAVWTASMTASACSTVSSSMLSVSKTASASMGVSFATCAGSVAMLTASASV